MATGKKSFVMYCDQKEMFEHLPAELCKELLMHLFMYVNDENPVSDNPILNALFAPIKHQLKRDLKVYEAICERNKKNGKGGGRPKKENPDKPKKPSGLSGNPDKPKKPDNDNDNDTVNDIDIRKKKYPCFEKTKTSIMTFWSFTEQNNFRQVALIDTFLNILISNNRYEYFKEQFTAYRKVKADGFKHNLENFTGSVDEKFENGKWCAENYIDTLKTIPKKQNNSGLKTGQVLNREQSMDDKF